MQQRIKVPKLLRVQNGMPINLQSRLLQKSSLLRKETVRPEQIHHIPKRRTRFFDAIWQEKPVYKMICL
jgi:hypothetical protein